MKARVVVWFSIFAAALALMYLLLYLLSGMEAAITALNFATENLIDLIIIFTFACLLAGLIDAFIEKEMILRFFNPKRNDIMNYFIATIVGIATPGPVYGIFPIVLILKKKGARSDFLISYLTGQTLMGPMRVPLELLFLGVNFLIYRTIITVAIGIMAGLLSRPFVKWVDAELEKKLSK